MTNYEQKVVDALLQIVAELAVIRGEVEAIRDQLDQHFTE